MSIIRQDLSTRDWTIFAVDRCDILTVINYRASLWGFGSCFTEPTCSAEVVLSTGFNLDVSHPIIKYFNKDRQPCQSNKSHSHLGFEKPRVPAFVSNNPPERAEFHAL